MHVRLRQEVQTLLRITNTSTPGGIAKRLACLLKSCWLELGDLSRESEPWNGVAVVEVHDAIRRDAVVRG
jgi:hypothetical protein